MSAANADNEIRVRFGKDKFGVVLTESERQWMPVSNASSNSTQSASEVQAK